MFVASSVFGGVAKVNEVEYDTLDDAVEAAEAGATITMLQDFEAANVYVDKSLVIDFNGKKGSFGSPAIQFGGSNVTLEFKNGAEGASTIDFSGNFLMFQGSNQKAIFNGNVTYVPKQGITTSFCMDTTAGLMTVGTSEVIVNAGTFEWENAIVFCQNVNKVTFNGGSVKTANYVVQGAKIFKGGYKLGTVSSVDIHGGSFVQPENLGSTIKSMFSDVVGLAVDETVGEVSISTPKALNTKDTTMPAGAITTTLKGGTYNIHNFTDDPGKLASGADNHIITIEGGNYKVETFGSSVTTLNPADAFIPEITINSGTFNKSPKAEQETATPLAHITLVADEGTELIENEDGTFTWGVPVTPEASATIVLITHADGTTAEFETLALALAAVQDGDTVKLGVDSDLADGNFTIAGNVVLDLNGKNIASKGTVAINNGAALKIVNGQSATSTWTWTGMTYLFNVASGAKLQLEDGVKYDVQGSKENFFPAGYFVSYMGDVVMNGGEVVQSNPFNAPFSGTNIEDVHPTLVINGGKVSATHFVENGGSDVTIKGGEFKVKAAAFTGAHTVEIVGGEFDLGSIAIEGSDVKISGGTFKKTIPEAFMAPDYGLKEIKDAAGNVIGYGVKSVFSAAIGAEIAEIDFDTRDPEARLVALGADDVFQYTTDGWKEAGAGSTAEVTLKLNGVDAETHLTSNEDGTLAWSADRRGMYLFTYKSGDYTQDARFYVTDLINQIGDAGEVTATYDEEGNVIALNVKLLSDITKQLVINEKVDVNFNMNGKNIMIAESASDDPNGKVAVVLAQGTTNKVNFKGNGTVKGGDAYEAASDATGGYAVAYVDADGKYQTDKTGERGTKEAGVSFVDGAQGVQLKLLAVKQRYPWNGLVDMKYKLSRDLKSQKSYRLTITVTPKGGDAIVISKDAIVHEPVYTAGEHVFTWDALKDMPGLVLKGAKVKLDLEIHD